MCQFQFAKVYTELTYGRDVLFLKEMLSRKSQVETPKGHELVTQLLLFLKLEKYMCAVPQVVFAICGNL